MTYSMVKASELPQVQPQWNPRQLTGAEIVSLATGRPIAGVDPHHPVVQAIRSASLTSLARSHLNDAREKGYLWRWRNHADCSWHGPLSSSGGVVCRHAPSGDCGDW